MILITTNNYFGTTTNFAYGQTNQAIINNANPLNIKNIPVKKVHVGDIVDCSLIHSIHILPWYFNLKFTSQ